MPTYNYKCNSCKKEVVLFHGIHEKANSDCSCKGKLIRVITGGSGLVFKGSGFYETDYKGVKESQTNNNKTELKKGKKANDEQNKSS